MMAAVSSEMDPIEWLEDVSPARWNAPRLHPSTQDVGSVIPAGFEAYGRLFHPVDGGGHGGRERWSDVARRNQRVVHPEMQFHWISCPLGQRPPDGYHRGDGPSWGSLPVAERRVLVAVLARYTTTPNSCFFCVWEGSGSGPLDQAEEVELPHRRYYLYGGPLEAALAPLGFDQSPNLWWPEDHAWFVATEVDYAWTYVGGPRDLIDELMADERLEVLPARLSDEPFYDSDILNEAIGKEAET